jgi:hypothetical protein
LCSLKLGSFSLLKDAWDRNVKKESGSPLARNVKNVLSFCEYLVQRIGRIKEESGCRG